MNVLEMTVAEALALATSKLQGCFRRKAAPPVVSRPAPPLHRDEWDLSNALVNSYTAQQQAAQSQLANAVLAQQARLGQAHVGYGQPWDHMTQVHTVSLQSALYSAVHRPSVGAEWGRWYPSDPDDPVDPAAE